MQIKAKGDLIIKNGNIEKINLDRLPTSGLVVYEVLRVIQGIPLFFEDHFKRLLRSVELVGRSIDLNERELFLWMVELGKTNNIKEGNLMIKIYFLNQGYETLAYFIPHQYPSIENVLKGVEVGLLQAERTNPEAKVENFSVRERANSMIQSLGVFEVLLVDQFQQITEGSRSNFLAIKSNAIHSAPVSKILMGITLLKTIEIAASEGIEIQYESVLVNDLPNFDSLFLTGTSPKILPISKINQWTYNTNNPILLRLMERYERLIVEDIAKKRDSFSNPL